MSFGQRGAGPRPLARSGGMAKAPAARETNALWDTFRPFAPWIAIAVVGLPALYLGSLAGLSVLTRPPTLASTDVGPSGARGVAMVAASGDEKLDAAIVRARASLGEFWSRSAAPAQGDEAFMVKVALRTRKGGLEHIWVASPVRNGDTFTGRLANDPQDMPGVKAGARIEFSEAQISDWMYRRDGKIVGNRTLRVLVERMPEEQAAQYRAMLAD